MVSPVDVMMVKNAIVHLYENLYCENKPSRLFVDGIAFGSIILDVAKDVEKDFTEDEVWNAITKLGNEKALRLDDFNIAFFHRCWSIVKGKIIEFFANFHKKRCY